MEKYHFTDSEFKMLEGLPVPMAVYQFTDKRVMTLVLSKGFCSLLGYRIRSEAYHDMDHNMFRNVHPNDVARISDEALRFATHGGTFDVICRIRPNDQPDYHVVHLRGEHRYTPEDVQLAYVWFMDEGVYQEDAEAEGTGQKLNAVLSRALHDDSFLKASHYDHLTGLPSMTYFFELAEHRREEFRRQEGDPAFLYMNFCGMKYFNSRHGFSEGDNLLREFAVTIRHVFGNENCCRLGADEFVVITMQRDLEERLRRFFRDCRDLNEGNSLPIRVGIYLDKEANVGVSTACDRAKLACGSLKNTFVSSFIYYSIETRNEAERKQYILMNLDRAMKEGWIQVYYQPLIRSVNRKVCDEEALSRWIDPNLGFLSPAEFIPVLEDAGVIHQLDLYVLDQVLKKIQEMKKVGITVVPQSINLSRKDFDACNIVEEIRRRVDAAGVSRDKITIEITESVIGKDLDFMRKKVRQFHELGFAVWMDDFGSGYSSLDVLQSIPFDVIKFDLSFMRRLDEGEAGKIVLTELMKMANALGMSTVCEGVETMEQVRFLQEIGCSKLQGYYFEKPLPLEKIIEKYEQGRQIGFENPDSTEYFETISRINLYDYAVIAGEERQALQGYFNTLPMGIIEVRGKTTRFLRSNQSYRDFIKQYIGLDLSHEGTDFSEYGDAFMYNVVQTCCEKGNRSFYDEKMPGGSVVHSYARRLAYDPASDTYAVGIVVLSITDSDEGATYAEIARALAADYYNIYYIDVQTDAYIEYVSAVGEETMAREGSGEGFFDSARRETLTRIHPDDQQAFLEIFTKEQVLQVIDEQGVFRTSYRLMDLGEPVQVNMKITRMPDRKHLILGISIVDFPSEIQNQPSGGK